MDILLLVVSLSFSNGEDFFFSGYTIFLFLGRLCRYFSEALEFVELGARGWWRGPHEKKREVVSCRLCVYGVYSVCPYLEFQSNHVCVLPWQRIMINY